MKWKNIKQPLFDLWNALGGQWKVFPYVWLNNVWLVAGYTERNNDEYQTCIDEYRVKKYRVKYFCKYWFFLLKLQDSSFPKTCWYLSIFNNTTISFENYTFLLIFAHCCLCFSCVAKSVLQEKNASHCYCNSTSSPENWMPGESIVTMGSLRWVYRWH